MLGNARQFRSLTFWIGLPGSLIRIVWLNKIVYGGAYFTFPAKKLNNGGSRIDYLFLRK